MSLVDVDGDPWLREHEACEKLFREIAAQLSERDSQIPSSAAYGKLSASIRVRLRQFEVEVQQLRGKLSVTAGRETITPHEAERRKRLVEHLESGIRQLQQRFSTRNRESDDNRSQLLTNRAGSSNVFADMGTTGWGNEPDSDTFDVARAQSMTQQVIREQDAGLEELAKIISRQKDIARTIGDEVDVHNEILDDLADGIDRTTVGLMNETRQVRTISRKDSTCGLWTVIILLFIAILVIVCL
ncbi:syntaxin-8 [Frankliniella occidentalis]|uniref:Syntaxin-8 n=1 Tax=Frankliniella occidentalis TaxID=133901 RepID=A0A6J1RXB1_FRAOC|nr:syntaxin-8 [Frankliniella occidentalis]